MVDAARSHARLDDAGCQHRIGHDLCDGSRSDGADQVGVSSIGRIIRRHRCSRPGFPTTSLVRGDDHPSLWRPSIVVMSCHEWQWVAFSDPQVGPRWRKGRDSNPRSVLPDTRFPGARTRPTMRPFQNGTMRPPAAERAGFEPAVARHHTAFREQHLKPLGHLSARDCTKHRVTLSGSSRECSPMLTAREPAVKQLRSPARNEPTSGQQKAAQ